MNDRNTLSVTRSLSVNQEWYKKINGGIINADEFDTNSTRLCYEQRELIVLREVSLLKSREN